MLLVGFMGSGKSVVGRRLASRLGWRFLDMDAEIERHEGTEIAEIFRTRGEDAFREVEAVVARRLLAEDRVVVASGGGWPCRPDRLENLDPETRSIWLRVSAEVAAARARASRTVRPLLEVENPQAQARRLLEIREPFYRKADWVVDTDGRRVRDVVREVAARLEAELGA